MLSMQQPPPTNQPIHWDNHRVPMNLTLIFALGIAVIGLFTGAPVLFFAGMGVAAYTWFTRPRRYLIYPAALVIEYGRPRVKVISFAEISHLELLSLAIGGPAPGSIAKRPPNHDHGPGPEHLPGEAGRSAGGLPRGRLREPAARPLGNPRDHQSGARTITNPPRRNHRRNFRSGKKARLRRASYRVNPGLSPQGSKFKRIQAMDAGNGLPFDHAGAGDLVMLSLFVAVECHPDINLSTTSRSAPVKKHTGWPRRWQGKASIQFRPGRDLFDFPPGRC